MIKNLGVLGYWSDGVMSLSVQVETAKVFSVLYLDPAWFSMELLEIRKEGSE
jgi:hypothetical protein